MASAAARGGAILLVVIMRVTARTKAALAESIATSEDVAGAAGLASPTVKSS
jgi:hypothetical protein